MPCICDDYGETESDQKLLLDKLTRMLCSVLAKNDVLEEDSKIQLTKETSVWWQEHKKADAKRKQLEKQEKRKKDLAVKALKKLTVEEQKALGL